jgi:hypothetical protein
MLNILIVYVTGMFVVVPLKIMFATKVAEAEAGVVVAPAKGKCNVQLTMPAVVSTPAAILIYSFRLNLIRIYSGGL